MNKLEKLLSDLRPETKEEKILAFIIALIVLVAFAWFCEWTNNKWHWMVS